MAEKLDVSLRGKSETRMSALGWQLHSPHTRVFYFTPASCREYGLPKVVLPARPRAHGHTPTPGCQEWMCAGTGGLC